MSTSKEKKAPQNRTYTVDDIASVLGIGRATAYKLTKSGEFKIIRIGNAIWISRQSFEEWLGMEEPEEENE
ncbi:MAG: helix-turn-helix domain-containing protein [Elusimicrobiales bacterium]|nr:helix-turn-helix domain-containing protein [Elusimicrobiales bacterium]